MDYYLTLSSLCLRFCLWHSGDELSLVCAANSKEKIRTFSSRTSETLRKQRLKVSTNQPCDSASPGHQVSLYSVFCRCWMDRRPTWPLSFLSCDTEKNIIFVIWEVKWPFNPEPTVGVLGVQLANFRKQDVDVGRRSYFQHRTEFLTAGLRTDSSEFSENFQFLFKRYSSHSSTSLWVSHS